jgi:hypothetical protein
MRGITVGVTLAIVVLVLALYLPTQHVGAQPAEKFDLEKAITGAKTAADHEAIASYYDREAATTKDKAAEHYKLMKVYSNLAGKGHFRMEDHCQKLAQNYESIATEYTSLAGAHRQMAREAPQQK